MASRPTSTDALEAESTEAQGSTEHRAPVPSPPTRAADAPTFAHALDAELTEIQSSREKRTRIPPSPRTPLPPIPTGTPENAHDRAADAELLGLAFSGGGIRSATFNLGILQGLAKYGLLPRFDYLSTVSSGGYIGSWLSAWIRRSGLAEVEKSLAGRAASVDQPEVPQISHLRQFSNYLTPKKGFFSADTWTMVSIYLRNLLLNLVILVTGLGAVLLIPRFVAVATGAAQGDPSDPAARYLIAAGLSLIVAIAFTARNVVSFKSDQTVQRRFRSQGMVQVAIVVPLFIASWCLAAGLQRLSGTPLDYGWWIAFGVGLLAGLDIIIRLSLGSSLSRAFGSAAALAAAASLIALELFLLRPWLRVGFAWSPVTGLNLLETLESQTLWGVPLLASAGLLGVIFYVGLMGRAFDTGVREWWARLVAWVLLYAAGWVVLFGVAFTGPEALDRLGGWAKTGLTSGWILSTLGGLVAGESSKSGGKKSQVVMSMMATVAPFVFVAGLLLALSALLEALVPGVWFLSAARLAIVFSALLALALLLSWRVDINEFSMHNFYRNRLLRCYAGASNKDRHEHPFTGFDASEHLIRVSDLRVKMPDDPNDAQRRASLKYGAKPYVGPYHIVNAALNLVGSKNLAWQQRKASSFVFAPLYSGYEIPAPGQSWRPTEQFDNGLSLGTAMAISGAAASPNMGYHSSSALTFLMMVFNVRLGWWLGNPRRDDSWPRSGPRIGIFCMIRELMGMTDEDYKYVYLSDGGHFENLGIYELVRRRCQFIVSCDAGAYPGLEFGDLGNAIEKCRTDFGVDIEIDVTSIRRPANASYSSAHCAVGKIRYDKIAPNMPPGTLLYIKASLTGDEPTDVLRYHAQNAAFPHQGTGDQFFDETQFESYRALGSHVLDEVLDAVGSESVVEETPTDDLFLKLRQSWYPPSSPW